MKIDILRWARAGLAMLCATIIATQGAFAAADRQLPTSLSTGPITGPAYMDAVSEEVTALWNAAPLQLSSIGGTANAVTASVTPALTGSLVDGMAFYITPSSTNTGAVTLQIGSLSAVSVVDSAGTALAAGSWVSGQTYLVLYRGTPNKFYVLGPSQASGALSPNYQVFTSSGTWTKPTGASTNTLVYVECWGGGGGGAAGGSAGGGGGGGYNSRWFRATDLGATETVTIGAGGATNSAGGTTSFGTKLYAYGGGASTSTSWSGGGGGGGPDSAGASTSSLTGGKGGRVSGGAGGGDNVAGANAAGGGGGGGGTGTGANDGRPGGDGYFGGGGGGGGDSDNVGGAGGSSHWGGGAAIGGGSGGTSTFGGAGGAPSVAGTAPGGGGGYLAAGARGECRVYVP